MHIVTSDNENVPTSNLVEILTLPGIDLPLGYKFSGLRAGPAALISAQSRITDAIFERLALVPTLPWLRGSIYLMSQEVMDRADARILKAAMAEVAFDEAILLPFADASDTEKAACQGYWTTLRLCARLGIIKGRGVPRSTVAAHRKSSDSQLHLAT